MSKKRKKKKNTPKAVNQQGQELSVEGKEETTEAKEPQETSKEEQEETIEVKEPQETSKEEQEETTEAKEPQETSKEEQEETAEAKEPQETSKEEQEETTEAKEPQETSKEEQEETAEAKEPQETSKEEQEETAEAKEPQETSKEEQEETVEATQAAAKESREDSTGEKKGDTELEKRSDTPFVVETAKTKKRFPVWAIVCIVFVVLIVGGYGFGVVYFMNHFGWNTTLNGIDISGMNENQVQAELDNVFYDYILTLEERDGKTEIISASDVNLEYELKGTVREELQKQNSWLWFMTYFDTTDLSLDASIHYDVDKLYTVIKGLNCMDRNSITYPVEPHILKKATGYVVEDGIEGNLPLETAVRKAVSNAIDNLSASVNLEDNKCYVRLKHSSEDQDIQDAVNSLNTLRELKITYDFGDDQAVVDGARILSWVNVNHDYGLELDTNAMLLFMDSLNEEYRVSSHEVNFDTYYGNTVTINSYLRKAVIDPEEEVEKLQDMILDACQTGRTEYTRSSENMFSVGDTYIEINLTAQKMFCYKDGRIILETDIVSGRPSTGNATPPGVYNIFAKSSPAILVGETYRTPVSYWMPFNGGIGLHDATWQSAFGGMRYITNGSHGCINLRLDVAKFLYENYSVGDLVILYHMAGTESTETTPAGQALSSPVPVHTEAPTEEATEASTEAPATEPPTTAAPTTEVLTTETTSEESTATSEESTASSE